MAGRKVKGGIKKKGGRRNNRSSTSGDEYPTSSNEALAAEAQEPKRKRTSKKEMYQLSANINGIRQSQRKTGEWLQKEIDKEIHRKIISGSNEPKLYQCYDSIKGRGMKARERFHRGEFVVEYKGEILGYEAAKAKEREYQKKEKVGSFMYYFEHGGKKWCVDATKETQFKGRLINHSRLKANLKTKAFEYEGCTYLILVASREIECNEELLYNYGDRSSEAIANHPWLVNS